ncbi:MAG TPA: glycoside-pentoside-hexuronide (GPH):cation symporter [Candidatus Izemoplasmatales bacterium]|nr:glycoside-pentoside-hexuronide (GPH):cation symporter [Bacillota bacterium]HRY77763.1 glycoside-pentoside-hexuronide (GPH):cation symporter [Candidatus Izemoplasmatales bacterium]
MDTDIKLSFGKKLRFGVGDFGMSVIIASIQFYMLFYYTDVVKIDPAIAGTAMLVGKLTWDMINDGLFGYLIDKTKTRWGRTRPYLMFCSVPLGLSFWLLFSLPSGMSNAAAFFAILGTFVVYDTFGTLVNTAYSAMTATLTTDYNERTSLATARMGFNVVGYILGAGITTLLATIIGASFGVSAPVAWSWTGLFFGILAMATILITAFSKDLKSVVEEAPSRMPPISALLSTFKNKPFRQFMIISAIMSTAFTLVTTMLAYFIKYQVLMEDQGSMIMLTMLGTLALFLVPCKLLADRIGKAKTYAWGLVVACVGLIAAFFLPHQVSTIIYAICLVAGIGFSSQWVCPHSMMPDVIEYDELMIGERREGIYYGVWGMVGKVTGALGAAICGWGLKLFGYVDGVEQDALSRLGIRLMFAVIPAVLLLICVPMLLRYPIDKKTHALVTRQLAERKSGHGTVQE